MKKRTSSKWMCEGKRMLQATLKELPLVKVREKMTSISEEKKMQRKGLPSDSFACQQCSGRSAQSREPEAT